MPLVAGVVLVALGVRKTLTLVSHTDTHPLSAALTLVTAVALFGGLSLYLASLAMFHWRLTGTVSWRRLALAAACGCGAPIATQVPALASMATLACLMLATESARGRRGRDTRRSSSPPCPGAIAEPGLSVDGLDLAVD